MDVVLVRWPEEDTRLRQLRDAGSPRLLLLTDEAAPESADCLEDWIRLPADERDVRARVARLATRAENRKPEPQADGDGLLRYRGRAAALTAVAAALAALV